MPILVGYIVGACVWRFKEADSVAERIILAGVTALAIMAFCYLQKEGKT